MPKPDPSPEEDQFHLRVGAAALGLLAGLVIGALVAFALFMLDVHQVPMAVPIFASAFTLAPVCFVWPDVAFLVTLGLGHFVIGAAQGAELDSSLEIAPPETDSAPWLKLLFWVGVALGVAACVADWLN